MQASRSYISILSAAFFLSAAITGFAQDLRNWRVFRSSDGLRESRTVGLSQGPRGRVWVLHRDEDYFSVVDRHTIETIPAAGAGKYGVHEGPSGQLWATYRNGVQILDPNSQRWQKYPLSVISEEHTRNPAREIDPIPIASPRLNHLHIVLHDAVHHFTTQSGSTVPIIKAEQLGIGAFRDTITTDDGFIWITGDLGIARFHRRTDADSIRPEIISIRVPEELGLKEFRRPTTGPDGSLTMIATMAPDNLKTIVRFADEAWHPTPELRSAWGAMNLKAPRRAWYRNGVFRAVTLDSVVEFDADAPAEVRLLEAPTGSFFDGLPTETSENFWVASLEGLLRHVPLPWQAPHGLPRAGAAVSGICEQPAGTIWIAAADSLMEFASGSWTYHDFPNPSEHVFQADDKLLPVGDDWLLLTVGDRNLVFDTETRRFLESENGRFAGVRPIGFAPGGIPLLLTTSDENAAQLLVFEDGVPRTAIDIPAFVLASRSVQQAHIARNGDIWLATDGAAIRYSEEQWTEFTIRHQFNLSRTTRIFERADGSIHFAGETRILRCDGLRFETIAAGFDQVNDVAVSPDGTVWVATGNGLHGLRDGVWLVNEEADGIPGGSVYTVFEDSRNRTWIGTNRGPAIYNRAADPDGPIVTQPPANEFALRPQTLPLEIEFSGSDLWAVTAPERLLFSTQLDGGPWQPFSDATSIRLDLLAAGPHEMFIRAIDRNWNISPIETRVAFEVVLPWQDDPRVKWALQLGAVGVLAFAGLAYNRHRKLRQSYEEVERIVEERTHQLELANRELLHSQKMRALGTMAAGVAHDFNSILSIIRGSTQLISRNIERPEKIRTRVHRILSVIDQGNSLVKAMLGFGPNGTPSDAPPIDINVVVRDTMHLVEDRLDPKVKIVLAADHTIPDVRVPREVLQQILINLVFNAADAIGHEGTIEIKTEVHEHVPVDSILRPREASSYVVISVLDHGCGIPPDALTRIFEPFFTTKSFSDKRGTGLGLSMVYEYAEDMNLGIAVRSQMKKFTEIQIYIPVNKEEKKDSRS